MQQSGVQKQAHQSIAFQRLEIAALFHDTEGICGADFAVDVAVFLVQDGAVGAEP